MTLWIKIPLLLHFLYFFPCLIIIFCLLKAKTSLTTPRGWREMQPHKESSFMPSSSADKSMQTNSSSLINYKSSHILFQTNSIIQWTKEHKTPLNWIRDILMQISSTISCGIFFFLCLFTKFNLFAMQKIKTMRNTLSRKMIQLEMKRTIS